MLPSKDNVVSINSATSARQAPPGDDAHPLAISCRNALTRHVKPLMQSLFDNVDDALFERADRAESNAVADLYFDAMREVRKRRDGIEKTFLQKCLETHRQFWAADPVPMEQRAPESPSSMELSLVEDSDVEEGLAITNMASKAENHYRDELFNLEQRFSHIAGRAVETQSIPIGPLALCQAFRGALQTLETDFKVKLVIYKLFDRYVMSAASSFYEDVNALFVKAGVLPDLTDKVRVSSPSHRPSSQTGARQGPAGEVDGSGGGAAGTAEEAFRDAISSEVFDTLRNLLTARRTGANAASAESYAAEESTPAYAVQDVLSTLSSLQTTSPGAPITLASRAGAESGLKTALLAEIVNALGEDGTKAIGHAEEDAIDVIGMLFEFILNDRNLPDAMRALISRLQIPILKVAILDKSFFSNSKHSARRLLNELAQAGIGWTEQDGRSANSLYGKIESIVERVLSDFQDNVEIFAELLDAFRRMIEHQDKGSQLIEGRSTQVAQGKEKLDLAKRRVAQELEARLKHRDVPELVCALLEDGWKDLMVLIHLRQGVNSEAWNNALSIVDTLLWSVQPKKTPEDRQKMIKEMPTLLKDLREGLSSITYDYHRMVKFFKELQDLHLACLRGNSVKSMSISSSPDEPVAGLRSDAGTASDASAEGNASNPSLSSGPAKWEQSTEQPAKPLTENTPDRKKEGAEGGDKSAQMAAATAYAEPLGGYVMEEIVLAVEEEEREPEPEEADEYDRQAEQLGVGSWLEFTNESGECTRAKLAWKSDITSSCLFVNRNGLKVAEKNIKGLAVELRRGSVVILENVPLMDRAMDAMMHTLRRTAPETASNTG